jgi:hypothetical protein
MDDVLIPNRAPDSHSHELSHTAAGAVGVADIIKADFTLCCLANKRRHDY